MPLLLLQQHKFNSYLEDSLRNDLSSNATLSVINA